MPVETGAGRGWRCASCGTRPLQALTNNLSVIIDNVKCKVWITREEVGGARENVVACGYMTTTDRRRETVKELRLEHDLSEKQANFVVETVENPTLPVLTRAKNAGYTHNGAISGGYRQLKSPKVKGAIKATLQKRANLKIEMQKLEQDPRGYLKERFLENANDENITAVQHASLEAIAKLDGLYTQKIEVDMGEKTRAAWVLSRMPGGIVQGLLAQPSQENT